MEDNTLSGFTKNKNTFLLYCGDKSQQDISDFEKQGLDQTFEKAVYYHLVNSINFQILPNGYSNFTYYKATHKVFSVLITKGWSFNKEISDYLYELVKDNIIEIKKDWSINQELKHYMCKVK